MQKVNFKKLTALGIVLLAASAVAAAFMPSKTKTIDDCNSIIVDSTTPDDNGLDLDRTCTVAIDEANCWTRTGSGSGAGTSSGTTTGITTSNDTRFSHGVAACIEV
ncbi:hypothetical protein HB364_32600 [Pseudoflavitalea sp. X16]|uniref:hypothetical protein n=1 Tax=Paraflavitalea devenefica TaxID=2716334 RepID=UPI00141E8849|nr:hypothetical protein [Paraflavitalea devenefica]NII29864.1 hypothetical protein [Paraflavitalea devenefica]